MNGPEHYAEAERLLEAARKLENEYVGVPMVEEEATSLHRAISRAATRAHAHATLALAAATVESSLQVLGAKTDGWVEVIGVTPFIYRDPFTAHEVAPELSADEQATVERFGIHDGDGAA